MEARRRCLPESRTFPVRSLSGSYGCPAGLERSPTSRRRRGQRALAAGALTVVVVALLAPAAAGGTPPLAAPRPAAATARVAPSSTGRAAAGAWTWAQAQRASAALLRAAAILQRRSEALSKLGTAGQRAGMKLVRDLVQMLEKVSSRTVAPWVLAKRASEEVGRLAATPTATGKKPPVVAAKKPPVVAAKKPPVVAAKKPPVVAAKRPPVVVRRPPPPPVTRPAPVKKGISVAALASRPKPKLVDFRPLILASASESVLLDRRWRGVPKALLLAPPPVVEREVPPTPRPVQPPPPTPVVVRPRGTSLEGLAAEKKKAEAAALIRPAPADIPLLDQRWRGLSPQALAALAVPAETPELTAEKPSEPGAPTVPTAPTTVAKELRGRALSDLEQLAAATRATEQAKAKKATGVLAARAADVALTDRRWSPDAIPKIALLALPPPADEEKVTKVARAPEPKPTVPPPSPPTVPVQTSSQPLSAVAPALGKQAKIAAKWWADVPADIRLLDLRWSKRGAGRLVAAVGPTPSGGTSTPAGPSTPPRGTDVAGPLAGVVPLHLLQPAKIDLAQRSPLSTEEKRLLAGALPRGQAAALTEDRPQEKSDARKLAEILRAEAVRPVAAAPATPGAGSPPRKAASALEALAGKGPQPKATSVPKAQSTEERALLRAASER